MDPTRAAWRVLDDGAYDGPPGVDGAATDRVPSAPATRAAERPAGGVPWAILGAGGLLTIVLGVVAVLLVMSGPEPLAVVETGTERVAAVGPDASADPGGGAGQISPSVPATIVVHVAGAVRRPGLVTLPDGSRVADAIDAAGGLDVRADAARVGLELNLAERVSDGQRIVVPSRDDPSPVAGGGASPGSTGGGTGGGSGGGQPTGGEGQPVDLNHADAATLDTLPGVGPVTVGKIVAAREERQFRTLEELVERKVVSASTLEKIRDLVVIR